MSLVSARSAVVFVIEPSSWKCSLFITRRFRINLSAKIPLRVIYWYGILTGLNRLITALKGNVGYHRWNVSVLTTADCETTGCLEWRTWESSVKLCWEINSVVRENHTVLSAISFLNPEINYQDIMIGGGVRQHAVFLDDRAIPSYLGITQTNLVCETCKRLHRL